MTPPAVYGIELGVDVPEMGRVCAAEIGNLPDLSAALHMAERFRGKRATAALKHKEADTVDAGRVDCRRRITGATIYAYNDYEGTTWSHDLSEWESR